MNKLIKGDSLEALQAMNDDSVDLIYIDPPYYFDTSRKGAFNYNSDFELNTWIELMRVRLVEAKRVMNDTSIIFISINEDGMPYLRILGNQVFGASNFIENFIWTKPKAGKNNSVYSSTIHEYILCYAKSSSAIKALNYFKRTKPGANEVLDIYTSGKSNFKTNSQIEVDIKNYFKSVPELKGIKNYHNVDDFGIYYKCTMNAPGKKSNNDYQIIHPVTNLPCRLPPNNLCYTQETFLEMLSQNKIAFGETEDTIPTYKIYLTETMLEPARSTFENSDSGRSDLLELFDDCPFLFAKPTSLIKTLIAMHPKKDIKVLDFFAGSGTTGHAVMELNKEDGGSRSFILVEQMDYAEDLTKERIIRAMSKYEYDESFTYEVFDSHGQEDDASQESVKACDAS